MVLDSSPILAILFREEGHEQILAKLEGADLIVVGAQAVVEAQIAGMPLLFTGEDFGRTDIPPA